MKQKTTLNKAKLYKEYLYYSKKTDASSITIILYKRLKWIVEMRRYGPSYLRLMYRGKGIYLESTGSKIKPQKERFFNALFNNRIDTNDFMSDAKATMIIAKAFLDGNLL